ncbi:MAG: hypothetical protein ABSH20_17750 [Tepidisphaeraceae bacterium]|jgi:hypothetical protein
MKTRNFRSLGFAIGVVSLTLSPLSVQADQFFATQVISTVVGASQPAYFSNPALALGGPVGGGETVGGTDVYTLGVGGSLTLGFDNGSSPRVINNGPGPDFIVFENPLYAGGDPGSCFSELMYVEVSSNGVDFARFPVISNTPGPVSAYGTINPADVSGFGGVHPVLANVKTNNINPFDPTVAGGDAFDLSSVGNNPLVISGKVNLNAIRQVRLVDVIGDGRDVDSNGHPIYDPTGSGNNGADVDAIAVINGGPPTVSAMLIGAAGGSFNDASRWDIGAVPSGAGASADISALGGGATLSIAEAVRLGHLGCGSNSNTLAGPAMLTLDGGGASTSISGIAGIHTISAPVEFSGDVVLSAGGGTLLFTGPLTYDSDTAITIADGTVEFAVEQGPVSVGDNVVITIDGGATFAVGGSVNPLQDSITGQFMSVSYVAVPEPGALSCLCPLGCVLLRRRARPSFGRAAVPCGRFAERPLRRCGSTALPDSWVRSSRETGG